MFECILSIINHLVMKLCRNIIQNSKSGLFLIYLPQLIDGFCFLLMKLRSETKVDSFFLPSSPPQESHLLTYRQNDFQNPSL